MTTASARIRRRHPFGRVLLVVLAVLVTLALVAAGVLWWNVVRSFPRYDGTIEIAGLHHPVTVRRDDAGIPQITADDPHDLFLAQGYVHAQDRFWQMDFDRHVTAGTLSELFGASQVKTDTFIRTLGWRRVAAEEVKKMDARSLAYYRAYSAGVNAYLATHSGSALSLEYAVLGLQHPGYRPAPWTPVDSVAWLKAMAWDLRTNLGDEIDRALVAASSLPADQKAELHPGYPYDEHPTITGLGGGHPARTAGSPTRMTTAAPDLDAAARHAEAAALTRLKGELAGLPGALPDAGHDIGSNSWVVAGSHTTTGKPILANDPHLGAAEPSVWYQAGLHCRTPGTSCPFDVAGFGFAGLPGIVIGHNAQIAWGFTNAGPDVTDLYLEKIVGDDYMYRGHKVPLMVRHETIRVAGGKDVHITVRSTRHGPLVTDGTALLGATAEAASKGAGSSAPSGGYGLALEWTALTPGTTAEAVFTMNAARTWKEFRAAAKQFSVPAQNLVFADTKGDIGYQMPGVVPIRSKGDGTVPVPGWTGDYRWTGTVPFDALPSKENPTSGYIVTANNAAVGPDYPVMITRDQDSGYRADEITARLKALIGSGHKLTVADMARIEDDNHDQNADALVPILSSLTLHGDAARGVALLRGWNRDDDVDSAAAAYFNLFWRDLLSRAFGDKLPAAAAPAGGDRWFQVVDAAAADPDSPWWSDPDADIHGRDAMFASVAAEAYRDAQDAMGDDAASWSWGRLHRLELTNASLGTSGIAPIEALFNRGPYPVSGSSSVVDATGWDAHDGFAVTTVPSMRMVVDLAHFDRSTWINLTGESGHAFHPNYTDQTALWQHHRTRAWPFDRGAVSAATIDTLHLTPVHG